jgi:glutamyl-tRNA reductase
VTPRSRLIAVGLSHRTAAIAQRERAALGDAAARATLRALLAGGAVTEAAVLSTCNRTELYAAAEDLGAAERALRREHAAHAAISAAELDVAARVQRDEAVVGHLFRVAASLDSMVVGEAEIQGQVRAARDLAASEGALGPVLGALFGQALVAGRRVRARTQVGAGAVSLSSVAVALARAQLGDVRGRRAALIGAGRMAQATARALVGAGVGALDVVNRSEADAFGALYGARTSGLDALDEVLCSADVVVASTAAPEPVVDTALVRRACERRAACVPLVLVDLAVPRDVEPAVGDLPGVALYDLDHLGAVAAANRRARDREALRAQRIVDAEVARHLVSARAAARPALAELAA